MKRLRDLFRGFALRTLGLEEEDLVQELQLRLVTRSGTKIENADAYIAQAARGVALDNIRKVRSRGGAALAIQDADPRSLPWTAPHQEDAILLKQVILGLPPIYREVFVLNRFVGLTYEEIAQRYGITVKAVEYRMSRALALCQAALRD